MTQPKKPVAKAPAKKEPAKAEKPKDAPKPKKDDTDEGPGDNDALADIATYGGEVPADVGDGGEG